MEHVARYEGKLPFSPLELSSTDQDLTVRITGFSGDAVRTCIYYSIDNNPRDYQVQEAFLVDDQKRVYCLVSVERKTSPSPVSWMEFGALPPETTSLELIITTLQQSPIPGSFKWQGRSFVDPWDPEVKLTDEVIRKMDLWLGHKKNEHSAQWEKQGAWRFSMPTGTWTKEEFDMIKPLDFSFSLGKDRVIVREFRNSNTGAFIVLEVQDESMQKLGDGYKSALMNSFVNASSREELESSLRSLGLDRGYVPPKMSLRLRERERNILYSPDFVEAWGIIPNRWYHFFDHCICSQDLDILIQEISDVKMNPPLEIPLNPAMVLFEEPVKFSFDAGAVKASGEIYIEEIVFLKEGIKISYKMQLSEGLASLTFRNAVLKTKTEQGNEEVYPTLGSQIRLDASGEKLEKLILFPPSHDIEELLPDSLSLMINSVDIKLEKPMVIPFVSTSIPSCCEYRG